VGDDDEEANTAGADTGRERHHPYSGCAHLGGDGCC
jgi:hypothetical protein